MTELEEGLTEARRLLWEIDVGQGLAHLTSPPERLLVLLGGYVIELIERVEALEQRLDEEKVGGD